MSDSFKLFKYISFEKGYWSNPLSEGKLHFSTVEQLRSVNDLEEFKHQWDTSSYVFLNYCQEFPVSYNRLFSDTKVLCLSRSLNRKCWELFVDKGGVCYEFIYDKTQKSPEVMGSSVEYTKKRSLNAPAYFISQIKDEEIRHIFSNDSNVGISDLEKIHYWINKNGKEAKKIFINHIVKEIVLKKHKKFKNENEFRYVHVEGEVYNMSLETKFLESKLTFNELGLRLNRVITSDVDKVRADFKEENLKIIGNSLLR